MYYVFWGIDRVNKSMNFIDNPYTKFLLLVMIACSLFSGLRLGRVHLNRLGRTDNPAPVYARLGLLALNLLLAAAILILLVLLALLAPIILIPPVAKWFGAAGMSVVIVIVSMFSPLYLLGSYFLSMSYRPKLMRTLFRMFKKESGTGKKQSPRE
jgi:hypothetical protein